MRAAAGGPRPSDGGAGLASVPGGRCGLARLALPPLLLLLAGCLDFVGPDISREGPPRLFLLVALQDGLALQDGSPPTQLAGSFLLGVDSAGLRPTVVREEIRLGHFRLEPFERTEGSLRYLDEWDAWPAESAGSVIQVEGVMLADWPGHAELRLPIVRRDGPDSVTVAAGEDLVLPLRVAPEPLPEEVRSLHWRLTVQELRPDGSFGAPSITLGGDGMPPERLLLPAEWQPASAAPLRARFDFEVRAVRESEEIGYEMEGALRVMLLWHVSRADEVGPADSRPPSDTTG